MRWHDRRYHYLRRFWHFNFHRHGKPVVADVWVLCFAAETAARALVVPGHLVDMLSLSLLDATRRRSPWWRWRGRWDVVGGETARRAA